MSISGLPSFKLLIAGAIAALAYAHHKGVLFDPSTEGAAKTRPAVSAAPRPAKPVAPQKLTRDKSDPDKRKSASERSPRGMDMPRPKPLLTGAIRKEAKPTPPANIPHGAAGQVDRKP